MIVRLDLRSGEPIYLQIASQIKHLVAVGKLKREEQLPTVRELAIELQVDPNTVGRAYKQLADEGVISTRQGRGTYVLEQAPPLDQRKLRREKLVALADGFIGELERLGYTPDELEKVWGDRVGRWQKTQPRNS
ncbi:MAG: GntR family transcriptional regulator [Chloroflexi bacterium]|nr:GntR family transcriptional regulator [Chloroflexota bacterium]MBI5293643.1 GntR family transcriptional regulator [Chloroflexota bacterium]MBI5830166.1 GntR family transcriptional regulator [Chloroflexota bacterium]